MTHSICVELAQVFDRLNEIGSAIQDSGWDSAVERKHRAEVLALTRRRRQIWDSPEAKEVGINGGVDHEIFY